MAKWKNPVASSACLLLILAVVWSSALVSLADAVAIEKTGIDKGIYVVLGLPDGGVKSVVDLARGSDLTIYFQSAVASEVHALRDAAAKAGLLGRSVFVDRGNPATVHLADNLAGAILVSASVKDDVLQKEILRVLHPGGKAVVGDKEIVKPLPDNGDTWSHPYHGPDNNPQSLDRNARAPYLTQFLAEPMFSPMPEVAVAAGGRIYRAHGHISHKTNQNALLNTLVCASAYNGTIFWTRPLKEGFMIHRNTMIATPETLYLADDKSCKLIDPKTGDVRDEIVIPNGMADGPVWKWMALVDGVLYALIGGEEINVETEPSAKSGLGHWPWGMWKGHEYANPATNFGFGRTLVAVDPKTKKILWTHPEKEHLDSRGVCMRGNRIFCYSPEKFLACVNAKTGKLLWRNSDADLLEAIGTNDNGKSQTWNTGYSTSTYVKCNDDYIFFAGPQRLRLVVASTADGKIAWQKDYGNYQLVLADDGIYAAGPQLGPSSKPPILGAKLAYDTGKVLAGLPVRRACTRATGTVDSVFYRTSGGTVRVDVNSNTANHIAPMRPPCHDGVIISDGHLFWGPWMCGCQLSLYGHICLGPAGNLDLRPGADDSRLEVADNAAQVKPLQAKPGDWPTYQGDNGRGSVTQNSIPGEISQQWSINLPAGAFPTAPVTAGGLVFVGDRNGAVHALDAADGDTKWQAYTGGPVYFPPAVADGRVFVGSADGRVYAFEAVTGRALWNFRAAPHQRWIPVYGKLISTWPVAGGVAVKDGTVFAAAGIAHYDGTHVYALDAATGKVKWYNDSSGAISDKVASGISLQGALYLDQGEVRFLGGGAHETARYDQATGKCLNPPRHSPTSQFHTSFYAYYPTYGRYVSLDHTLADGRMLNYDVAYEGSWSGALSLLPALPAGAKKPSKPASRWGMQHRRGKGPKSIWQKSDLLFNGFIVSPNVLVGVGHTDPDAADSSFLAAAKIEDGQVIWSEDLPGPVVKAGAAVNHEGQIIVSLETGQVLCFAGK